IAAQTFRQTPDPREALRKFEARLVALGRAHNVLSDERWESADVQDIVNEVLEPFAAKDAHRLVVSGGDALVVARRAPTPSMVLHEVATNATKYGAWSSPTGFVSLEWRRLERNDGEWLWLGWRERGGPQVRSPDRRGFGSRLIEQSLAGIGGRARVEYDPGG